MGCISALGRGVPALWNGLISGSSGIRPILEFATDGLRNVHAGCIELAPELVELGRSRGIESRLELFATCAIDEALADAGLDPGTLAKRRAALVLGTSLGMSLVAATLRAELLDPGRPDTSGADLALIADRLAKRFHVAEGSTMVLSTACASGTHAIAMARDLLADERCEVVLAGGADSLDRMKYLGHSALGTLTHGVPRPFSRSRDGTLFGEGAAFLVLERDDRRAPGRAYARLRGAGYTTDIHHLTAPDPNGRGAARAIRAALHDARLELDDVDHVNLHGSGTALNDDAEARALIDVFGDRARDLACTSIKPAVGHAMGAAGAIEAVSTVLAIHHGAVPPTLHVTASDLAFPLGVVTERPRRLPLRNAISNSFGFGGANGVVVFGATDGARRPAEGAHA
jgi:3-oxoacyl-[acyl-carrier-protein] synthase II